MQSGRQVFGGGVLAELHALQTVVNTVTPTDLFSLALPAGRLQAGDLLILEAAGDRLVNAIGTTNYTMKLRIGSTYALNTGARGFGLNALRAMWNLHAVIDIGGATSQLVSATLAFTAPTSNTWDPISATNTFIAVGSAAEDTSTSKTIGFEVTMGSADPSIDLRVKQASLILLREAP